MFIEFTDREDQLILVKKDFIMAIVPVETHSSSYHMA